MPRSDPVDGFRLAYDRSGAGEPVVLLHGWPGDRTDYRILGPALAGPCEVVVPERMNHPPVGSPSSSIRGSLIRYPSPSA